MGVRTQNGKNKKRYSKISTEVLFSRFRSESSLLNQFKNRGTLSLKLPSYSTSNGPLPRSYSLDFEAPEPTSIKKSCTPDLCPFFRTTPNVKISLLKRRKIFSPRWRRVRWLAHQQQAQLEAIVHLASFITINLFLIIMLLCDFSLNFRNQFPKIKNSFPSHSEYGEYLMGSTLSWACSSLFDSPPYLQIKSSSCFVEWH